ncbi:hypothetical protein EMCRGX_G024745 [Ephydatia muelleri]
MVKPSAIQLQWSIEGLQFFVEAAVCKSLLVLVLLGTDVPELFTLLSRARSQEDSGMAVVTHFKLKQQQLEAREEHVRDLQSGARSTSMEEPTAKEKGLDTVPAVFQKSRFMTAAFQSTWAERKSEFNRGSSGLVLAQYQELQSLCSEFQDVLQGKPGCTTLTEHSIPTGSLIPVQQAPYRLPYVHREWVKKETEAMFLDRVIEPSTND